MQIILFLVDFKEMYTFKTQEMYLFLVDFIMAFFWVDML